MSWNSYCENLTKSGHVEKAAICGLDDSTIWSQSPGLNLSPTEVNSLIAAFKDPTNIRSGGINLGGTKYFCLQAEESQIQGKKGNTGVAIAKSNKCVVLGTYSDNQTPGNCRTQVENIRDYLQSSGY